MVSISNSYHLISLSKQNIDRSSKGDRSLAYICCAIQQCFSSPKYAIICMSPDSSQKAIKAYIILVYASLTIVIFQVIMFSCRPLVDVKFDIGMNSFDPSWRMLAVYPSLRRERTIQIASASSLHETKSLPSATMIYPLFIIAYLAGMIL